MVVSVSRFPHTTGLQGVLRTSESADDSSSPRSVCTEQGHWKGNSRYYYYNNNNTHQGV